MREREIGTANERINCLQKFQANSIRRKFCYVKTQNIQWWENLRKIVSDEIFSEITTFSLLRSTSSECSGVEFKLNMFNFVFRFLPLSTTPSSLNFDEFVIPISSSPHPCFLHRKHTPAPSKLIGRVEINRKRKCDCFITHPTLTSLQYHSRDISKLIRSHGRVQLAVENFSHFLQSLHFFLRHTTAEWRFNDETLSKELESTSLSSPLECLPPSPPAFFSFFSFDVARPSEREKTVKEDGNFSNFSKFAFSAAEGRKFTSLVFFCRHNLRDAKRCKLRTTN